MHGARPTAGRARGRRHTPGRAFAQGLLEVGDRADDLVEGTALAAGVGEPLAGEEAPGLVLVAPARLPALEQTLVDGRAHP